MKKWYSLIDKTYQPENLTKAAKTSDVQKKAAVQFLLWMNKPENRL
jgi:ABC-type glycerol-3-phosphate transport system substrate-binding protein